MKHGLRSIRAELEEGRAVAVYPHRWQVLSFLLLSCVILGIGLWILLVEARAMAGAERILFGGIGLVATGFGLSVFLDFLRRLIRSGPAMVLDPDGLHDFTHGRRGIFVPWSEVGDVFVGEYRRRGSATTLQRFVSIQVRDPDALKARVGAARFALLSVQEAQMGALVNVSEHLLPDAAGKWARILRKLAEERGRSGSGNPALR